jgi:hypothetical protein
MFKPQGNRIAIKHIYQNGRKSFNQGIAAAPYFHRQHISAPGVVSFN